MPFTSRHSHEGAKRAVLNFAGATTRRRILDMPSGNGELADALRALGHAVVTADIVPSRPEDLRVDMARPLPFQDEEFDLTLCVEGIEHVLETHALVRELTRITRRGGHILVSTPNVMGLYSRLQYLFTGFHFLFDFTMGVPDHPGEGQDRGHVTPVSYLQLRYLFGLEGARAVEITTDKFKRKALLPLYFLIAAVGWLWARLLLRRARDPEDQPGRTRTMLAEIFSAPVLLGRSLIVVFERAPGSASARG